jgi:hypothetical protein
MFKRFLMTVVRTSVHESLSLPARMKSRQDAGLKDLFGGNLSGWYSDWCRFYFIINIL